MHREQSATEENINKARTTRMLNSLMSSGFHRENGFDPKTTISCRHICYHPDIWYESGKCISETRPYPKTFTNKFNKLTQLLPVNTVDPAVYVLSSTLPIEAVIHMRVLLFFGDICRLPEMTFEHRIAVR